MALSRGDIVVLNLKPAKGHEVGKIRPGVVLSGDDENTVLETAIVMPLSTMIKSPTASASKRATG